MSSNPLFDELLLTRLTRGTATASGRPSGRRRALTPIELELAAEKGGRFAHLVHGEVDAETRQWRTRPLARHV